MPLGTYTCVNCHGTFGRTITMQEAMAEHQRTFSGEAAAAEELCIVCDDCYKEIMTWIGRDHPEWLTEEGKREADQLAQDD